MGITRGYLMYLVILMGLIGLLDWYLSTNIVIVLPSVLKEYSISKSTYSFWDAIYLIPTMFIFLLNGLNDIIGRKPSLLILLMMMGLPSIMIVFFASSFHLFMIFYAIISYALVSNMWTIPVEEEAPAEERGKLMGIVYGISLIPLAPLVYLLLPDRFGWKWMYGFAFFFTISILVMWIFMKETRRYEKISEERRRGKKKRHFYGYGVMKRKDLKYIAIGSIVWFCWLASSFHLKYAGVFLMDIHHYSKETFGIVFLISQFLCITSAFLAGWLMDVIGRRKTLYLGSLGFAISVVLVDFSPREFLPLLTPLVYFFFMFWYAWIVVYLPEIFPTEIRGTCVGWASTIGRPAYVIAPLIISLIFTLPKMEVTMKGFWTFTAIYPLISLLSIALLKPYETARKELEEIEVKR